MISTILLYVFVSIYIIAGIGISIYCINQLVLTISYLINQKSKRHNGQAITAYPTLCVQLPLYNEQNVVEDLLKSVSELDYPYDKLEVQILDDSTDETSNIISNNLDIFHNKGITVAHIRRTDRVGYKAGALDEGMRQTDAEFIAIFDADFRPTPTFLEDVMQHFKNENIALVQTRWEHTNEHYSLLTELQAMQLNVHFTIEQLGRYMKGLPLQFNGTAGIWRARSIKEAGGWQHDTLTEDLDLSYRVQMRNQDLIYVEKIGTPSELPVNIDGLKSQQFRWMKGGAQTAKKILPKLWSSSLPFREKVAGSIHLLGSSVYILVFLLVLVSAPLSVIAPLKDSNLNVVLSIFSANLVYIFIAYFVANIIVLAKRPVPIGRILYFFVQFPIFLAYSMGLSYHNALAVIEGWRGKESPFVRTPKFNINSKGSGFKTKKIYKNKSTLKGHYMEAVLFVYFVVFAYMSFLKGYSGRSVFLLLIAYGFASIFRLSLKRFS